MRPWVVELKPSDYRIVVTGELGSRYAASFEPMRLVPRDGMTEIVGRIEDDAHLTGLLDTVAALGLSLVSVSPVTPTEESAPQVRAEASSDGRGEGPRTAPS